MLPIYRQLFEKSSLALFNSSHAIFLKRERILPGNGGQTKGDACIPREPGKRGGPRGQGRFLAVTLCTGRRHGEASNHPARTRRGGAQTGRGLGRSGNGSTEPFRIAGR